MSEVNLSSAARAILEAAKRDGPSAAARAKMWGSVSTAMSGAAAASSAVSAAVATTGGVGAAKMLVLGTLLGGTLSVGVAATVLYVGQPRVGTVGAMARAAAADVEHERVLGASTPTPTPTPTPTTTTTSTPTKRPVASPGTRASHLAPIDGLAQEASLVAGARSSLASGDARGALQAIHDARGLSSRQLGPEELAVEAQALRALGRQDEANEADSTLKTQFPESALAR
jgi:hypothetical protein